MTLVVCAKFKGKMNCIADTRLSAGNSTISDSGGKIFLVPVTLRKFEKNQLKEKINYNLGFAFCGSTMLANNTHAISSNCSQLFRNDSVDIFPKAQTIAELYTKVAEYVMIDTNARMTHKVFFEGIIFGYCPYEKDFQLFKIQPEIKDSKFSVKCVPINLISGQCFAMGSGKNEFLEQIKRPNSAGNPREILEVVTQVMDESKVNDVGGFPQIAEATQEGVNLVPVLTQSQKDLDKSTLTINGFEINELELPDGLGVGMKSIGHGIEKIAGRQALRSKGIDPDSTKVSREFQNLASIEDAIKFAFKNHKKVIFDDNYSISKNIPSAGTWYYSAYCKNCKKYPPLITDYSNGSMGNQFEGNGLIKSICFYCDKEVNIESSTLVSKKWN